MVLKRFLLAFLTLCLVLSLSACGNANTEDASSESIPQKYIVKVVTEGGMALKGVTVMVYKDNTKTSLVSAGTTDDEGFLRFDAYQSSAYFAVLSGFPEGYTADSEYPILSKDNEFSVKSTLRNMALEGAQLKLGDIAFDFEITDVNGKTYKASELLKTKKAIVLNFWYENCVPCRMEFPYMQESYLSFSNNLEIFAINFYDGSQSSVKEYAESLSLTFP
ncbi:MAG: redoxin domain-containing protein, partial [Clostridia bacterium]|nr:redoxin domain-containing protein [Clostridia bacterium]